MMRVSLLALLAVGAIAPSVASAFDLGNGLAVTGSVKLEYDKYESDDTAVLDADLGLSWRSGGLIGFDAALDSTYIGESDEALTNIWAALVFSTDMGEFSVGAPRPVVESMAVLPRFGTSRLLDLETSFARGPLSTAAGFEDNGFAPGLAFTGQSGSVSYGLSYHRFEIGGDDLDLIQGVMNYSNGATTLFISGELGDLLSVDPSVVKIGGLYSADVYSFGGELARVDYGSEGITTGRLFGTYDVMPELTVKGDMLLIESSENIYSLGAEYRFGQLGFVEGGASFVDNDQIYDIGVGLKF